MTPQDKEERKYQLANTNLTGMRVPLTTGFPPTTPGVRTIRF